MVEEWFYNCTDLLPGRDIIRYLCNDFAPIWSACSCSLLFVLCWNWEVSWEKTDRVGRRVVLQLLSASKVLYCNSVYLYWEGCGICSIYLRKYMESLSILIIIFSLSRSLFHIISMRKVLRKEMTPSPIKRALFSNDLNLLECKTE